MESLVALRDRHVLLTGHTGFKGGWLALWLDALGAHVHGYSLDPPTEPSLFDIADVGSVLASDTRANLVDRPALANAVKRSRPEIVVHLAAQPLVRAGYRDPLGTLESNVIGTATLLEAIRDSDSVRAVVIVATDKVYENPESGRPFNEDDPLGGNDPYSASKAAAEIVVASYRASYFGSGRHEARIATARAGNVLGGGDWAADRLVPDCLRAFDQGWPVHLRAPGAVRPWQHVLGPLSGYLGLAARLLGKDGERFARPWNFGPNADDEASVGDVARRVAALWGGDAHVEESPASEYPEARLLRLDSTRARSELGWLPRWTLDEALARTVDWHRAWRRGEDMTAVTRTQIADYAAATA